MYSLIGIHYLKDKHIPVQDKRIIKRQFKVGPMKSLNKTSEIINNNVNSLAK